MARLAPVLHSGDLPLAELCAARLDGELVRVDDAFTPVDVHAGPAFRAEAVARGWSPRLIAEQHTAAWIWGARLDPPVRHQLCTTTGARARPAVPLRCVVREVAIDPDEYAFVGTLRVTRPVRTMVDIARFGPGFADSEIGVIRSLASVGGVGLDECRAALDRRRNLPAKKLAWSRLREALENPGLSPS
jgi:hypothetical protein